MLQLCPNKKRTRATGQRRWCFFLFYFLLCAVYQQCSYAAASKIKPEPVREAPATLIEYLVQEKAYLLTAIDTAKHSLLPKDEKEFTRKMQEINASLTINSAKIESLQSFLENQKKQEIDLNQRLKHLQQLPVVNAELTIQERVSKVEALLVVNNKTFDLINENLSLAEQLKIVLGEELSKLQVWKEAFALNEQLSQISQKKGVLNTKLSLLYQNSLSKPSDKKKEIPIESQERLLLNNQHVALIHHDLNVLNIQKRIVKANLLLLDSVDIKTIQSVAETYKDAIRQCIDEKHSLQQLQRSLNNETALITNPSLMKSLNELQLYAKQQIDTVNQQQSTLSRGLADYQNQLKKLISSRQSLSEYSINSWPVIIHKIVAIPGQCYKYIKILSLKVYDSYTWLDFVPALLLWMFLALILTFFIALNQFLKSVRGDKERSRLAGYLYDGVLVIVQRNIPYLCVYTMLWLVLYGTNISFSNYQLLFSLINVWFTFRILILIARLVLLERISDASGKDVKLYYRLKWLFLFGGWATALMVLGQSLPLSILLQDLFNRLFMLFILALSLVVWKSKDVIPYLLKPLLDGKKRYVKNAVSLLIILTPITSLSTAVIGLFGFVNLAWTMSGYQIYSLVLITAYVLVRGLIADALELFSEWMISSLENGWLWIEVLLKPLDKILRVILLLLSIFVLFQVFGWHSDSLVMVHLEQLAQYTLINFTGVYITVASVIEFLIVLAVFIWAAKWTREFCYRWLYKNARDAGIRNSLSIFTQYAVILLGSFITLHVLGLDLSGMSMILGGLAVGMGFGLRDFASNIVGGIMLLIERPVREGDLITLGEHEGRVAHIGIRSMRVSSWDNMEVLIPNAETFNKPFTNWTLQDSIIRTVVPIKVCRSDDPVMIQQLIHRILLSTPEVVSDPPSQVLLKKIDEALIEFEVRYFINVHTHSRVEIRSKVLFAITAQFKAAGIRPPIEPVAIEIKEGQGDAFTSKNTNSEDGK